MIRYVAFVYVRTTENATTSRLIDFEVFTLGTFPIISSSFMMVLCKKHQKNVLTLLLMVQKSGTLSR